MRIQQQSAQGWIWRYVIIKTTAFVGLLWLLLFGNGDWGTMAWTQHRVPLRRNHNFQGILATTRSSMISSFPIRCQRGASQTLHVKPSRTITRSRGNDNCDDVANNPNDENNHLSASTVTSTTAAASEADLFIPANLRRKVQAKRQPLGHVIPAATKKQRSGGGSANPRLRPQGQARQMGMNNPSMLIIAAGTAKGRRLDSPQVYLRPMMGKVREALFSTLTSFGLYQTSVSVNDKNKLHHLDLFAGSGSVGLESLSRGAAHCTFVDLSMDCCDAIQRNVAWCQFDPCTDMIRSNSATATAAAAASTPIRQQQEQHDTATKNDENNNNNSRTWSSIPPRVRIITADVMDVLKRSNLYFASSSSSSSFGFSNPLIPSKIQFDLITICPPYEEVVYADLLDAVLRCDVVGDDTIVVIEYPIELGTLPHVVRATTTTTTTTTPLSSLSSSENHTTKINNGSGLGRTMVGVRNRKYGRTVIAIYVINPTGRWNVESRPEEFVTL